MSCAWWLPRDSTHGCLAERTQSVVVVANSSRRRGWWLPLLSPKEQSWSRCRFGDIAEDKALGSIRRWRFDFARSEPRSRGLVPVSVGIWPPDVLDMWSPRSALAPVQYPVSSPAVC